MVSVRQIFASPAIAALTPSHPPPFRGRGRLSNRLSDPGIEAETQALPRRPRLLKGGGREGGTSFVSIGCDTGPQPARMQ